MAFLKGNTSIDLGDTLIENIFIDVYMPMANGTYVKVYLLAYKYACDKDQASQVDNITIAKNLNIPLSDVLSAWDFWESKKIIKKIENEDNEDYSVEFVNLKQLYIDNNYKSTHSQEQVETSAYTCSTKDIIDANHIPQVRDMFNEVNQIIMRPLVPNEKMQILEWIQNYNIDPPLIVKAYSYCKHKKNNKNVKYVGAVLRNWYDSGILSIEQLQEYLLKQGERYGLYVRVFKAMGFSYREPSESEKKIMDTWVDKLRFSLEIILKACENSSKTPNPNINYINSILQKWYDNDIKDLNDLEKKQEQTKSKPNTTKTTQPSRPNKTKFHLSSSRGDKYSAEELENLVLKNQKKIPNNYGGE